MTKRPTRKTAQPIEEPSLGPGPTLDQPTAPPAEVPLSPETLGILAWIDNEERGETDKLAGLEALAERQREALRTTLQDIEQSKGEIRMAQGSRFAVVQGAIRHHGLGDGYQLRGGRLTCLPE